MNNIKKMEDITSDFNTTVERLCKEIRENCAKIVEKRKIPMYNELKKMTLTERSKYLFFGVKKNNDNEAENSTVSKINKYSPRNVIFL